MYKHYFYFVPKRIELSRETIDKLIGDYHSLKSIRDVGKVNSLGYKTVWRVLRENNIDTTFGVPRLEIDIEMMKNYYKEDEIFLPVVGYETMYEISNYGRLKRLETKIHVIESGKDYYRTHGNIILKPAIHKDTGYCIDKLVSYPDGVYTYKKVSIHRLVAEAFIPNNNPDHIYVNHKDRRRWNNFYGNLEWCSPQDNIVHSHITNIPENYYSLE
jgi:hypothetical protein